MKKITNLLMVMILLVMSSTIYAQTITGTVNAEDGPLPGANVVVKGTTNGTQTDFDGKFTLKVTEGSGTVVVSFIGYSRKSVNYTVAAGETKDLGVIVLVSDNTLEEVVVTGVVDIAKDRQTPVAVSTIRAAEIVNELGSQEFPEILNNTPSVYATKSGGGFGDSRINIRGFDQRNIAVMINGVPVNDMENGWVYWSNWAGLSDVTTAMQVQRGLGSSKLAISSVGGTINVVTKTTDKAEGGAFASTVGNDGYLKTMGTYSTGKMENGFATSILLSRTAGDGYVDGTEFEGYNYFLSFGLDKGDHNFQFTLTGAPQTHNQRTTSFFNMATLEDYRTYGNRYNYNHGYLNGKEFNWRKNFYHKPIAFVNWDWDINDKTNLSTAAYVSFGRGGGTGDIGRLGGNFASSSRFRDPSTGEVLWDQIVASNSGQGGVFSNGYTYNNVVDPTTGTYIVNDDELRSDDLPLGLERRNGFIRRASMNSHNWYGILANLNNTLSDNLTLDVGIDLRSYKGIHYRRIDNLLGADGYRDNDDINNPLNVLTTEYSSDLGSLWNVFKSTDDEDKINYYNDGLVRWAGVFSQLEYIGPEVSAFIQGAISYQGFKRIDYFNYLDSDPDQETDWEGIMGGNIKGGLNWNIDEKHNIFVNAGYYSKQPNFDAVYINFVNEVNPEYRNEKVIGFEAGYGFRTEKVKANLNLYRTSWNDRFITVSKDVVINEGTTSEEEIEVNANISGVEQVHLGAELDVNWSPIESLRVLGMISVGDWEYAGNPSGPGFDQNQTYIEDVSLFLDGVKVGDAAQFTARLGLQWEMFENFRLDLSQRYVDRLYANISAEDFGFEDNDGSLELPGYSLVDAGLSYKLDLKNKMAVNFRFNVNNLANYEYISESATNYFPGRFGQNETYNGVNVDNKVFFGFGRTWNATVRFNF